MTKVAVLRDIVKKETKLIINELKERGVDFDSVDIRKTSFVSGDFSWPYNVTVERCQSHIQAENTLRILNLAGYKTVNTAAVARICGDKSETSFVLAVHNIPQPRFGIAYSKEETLAVMHEIGYPVVLKPILGSWGRNVNKIENEEEAVGKLNGNLGKDLALFIKDINDEEEVIRILNGYSIRDLRNQKIFYIQEHIDKSFEYDGETYNRDIRAFNFGGKTICAIYRVSKNFITNTAMGGMAINCPLNDKLEEICNKAAEAVGFGILALDLFETEKGKKYLVNEINYTPEFRNSIKPTGVDITKEYVDYVLKVAEI